MRLEREITSTTFPIMCAISMPRSRRRYPHVHPYKRLSKPPTHAGGHGRSPLFLNPGAWQGQYDEHDDEGDECDVESATAIEYRTSGEVRSRER
jgi:hypothetical protein